MLASVSGKLQGRATPVLSRGFRRRQLRALLISVRLMIWICNVFIEISTYKETFETYWKRFAWFLRINCDLDYVYWLCELSYNIFHLLHLLNCERGHVMRRSWKLNCVPVQKEGNYKASERTDGRADEVSDICFGWMCLICVCTQTCKHTGWDTREFEIHTHLSRGQSQQ